MDVDKGTLRWLLDADPSIRWQVMRDITREPDEVVAAERARVAAEGWGAELLARQQDDGQWMVPDPEWPLAPTLYTLLLLKAMGLDPASEAAQQAVGLVRDRVTWAFWGNAPFFEGEVEPCINGGVLAVGAYFGEASERLVDRLLSEQLADGGWNCDAERGSTRSSFHTTICVLEGLLAFEKAHGGAPAVAEARRRAQAYLLERRMLRRATTGEVISQAWTRFAFPSYWRYDLLRGLDYLRDAGVAFEERLAESVELVARRRHQNGRWPLGQRHPENHVDLTMEPGRGQASRWNTLRAVRVLDWFRG